MCVYAYVCVGGMGVREAWNGREELGRKKRKVNKGVFLFLDGNVE